MVDLDVFSYYLRSMQEVAYANYWEHDVCMCHFSQHGLMEDNAENNLEELDEANHMPKLQPNLFFNCMLVTLRLLKQRHKF